MYTQWIEQCTVQRVSLHEGLVVDLDDHNQLVISRPMRLTLPPAAGWPEEEVLIDPINLSAEERPLLTWPERSARVPGATTTVRCICVSPAATASMSTRMRRRLRGSSMASATATWRVCRGVESG